MKIKFYEISKKENVGGQYNRHRHICLNAIPTNKDIVKIYDKSKEYNYPVKCEYEDRMLIAKNYHLAEYIIFNFKVDDKEDYNIYINNFGKGALTEFYVNKIGIYYNGCISTKGIFAELLAYYDNKQHTYENLKEYQRKIYKKYGIYYPNILY